MYVYYTHHDNPLPKMLHVVDSVECQLYSSDEIARLSVVEVDSSCLYEHSLPKDGGVEDVRLGTSSRKVRCSTCYNSVEKCPTHTGFVKLHHPMYHSMFMDTIVKTLRCVCYWCSALLIDSEKVAQMKTEAVKKKYLASISLACKTKKTCYCCEGPQPKYTKTNCAIKADFSHHDAEAFESNEEQEQAQQTFTTKKALQIFRHISDEDLQTMGFATHPQNMILENLCVMAPACRPSVVFTEGSRNRGQDDLTLMQQDIVKINNQLKKAMDDGAPNVQYLIDMLQANIAQYFYKDTSNKANKRKSGGKIDKRKSIGDQLKGKTVSWILPMSHPIFTLIYLISIQIFHAIVASPIDIVETRMP